MNPIQISAKFSILCLLLALISCGKEKSNAIDVNALVEEGNVDKMKNAQKQLNASKDSLQALVNQLELKLAEVDTAAGKYTLVDLYQAQDTIYEHFIQMQASVQTEQDVQVTPEFSGVIRLNVREGQYVGRGASIGTIDDGGLRDQLNQAKIQVDQARSQVQQAEIQANLDQTTFQKQSNLWSKKIGSEIQYLQAKTKYESSLKQVQIARQGVKIAQKQVANVQANLRKTNLTAPFGGVVEEIITKSGQVVSPGVPVVRLVNPSNLKLIAEVPENYLSTISVGTKAVVEIPAVNQTITSKVSLVGASINPNNRTFTVEIPLDNRSGKIKPNLNAKIQLNDYSSENAIVIPENVILQDAEGNFVFITQKTTDGKTTAKKVRIETGLESNSLVEITKGLQSGDLIVSDGAERLQDGDLIKTLN